MILDAKQLRKIILDKKEKADAATVISVITTIQEKSEAKEKHYFRVILENAYDKVLDTKSVEDYLSMVAPVPSSDKFSYADEIKIYFEKNNIVLDEYNIVINNNTLLKAYRDEFELEDGNISKWIGVDFIEIR